MMLKKNILQVTAVGALQGFHIHYAFRYKIGIVQYFPIDFATLSKLSSLLWKASKAGKLDVEV